MSIPAKKLAQLQCLGRVTRPHQNEVALAAPDQLKPPQYEGPHEDLTQFSILRDKRAQSIVSQFQEFARFCGPTEDKAPVPGDHGHLAGKLAPGVGCNGALARKIRLHNLHTARKQDEKGNIRITRLEKDFTPLHLSDFADRQNAVDLSCGQDWKSLRAGI